jgi:hypothetical protein
MWGERPIALEKDVLARRIYAPAAYAQVRNTAVVPIVHAEAYQLASWFPIVWRRRGTDIDLVAVRSLLDDNRAQPPAARGLLPLLLQAYPFVLDPQHPVGPESAKMIDDVFADAPTDVGATITNIDRKLSRATVLRLRTLDIFAREYAVTSSISKLLADLNLFAPWELKFNIEGHSVEIRDLCIIRQPAFDTGALSVVLEKLGAPAAQLIGLHRISLFRAGILLGMARAFLKATSNAQQIGVKPSPAASATT